MRCVICRKKNAKACGQCKSIHYCSKECQKRDWRIHKVLCLLMTQTPPRPSEKHRLAFFFPESEQLPQLVWIKVLPLERCVDCRDPFCTMICEPHLRSYFGAEPTLRGLDDNEYMDRTNNYIYISGMDVCVNPRNGASSSSHGLRLTGLANSYRSDIPLSLGALTREFRISWRGPMVVQRQKQHRNGMCQVVTDVTLADLRLLVDYASALPHIVPNPTTMDDSGDEDD